MTFFNKIPVRKKVSPDKDTISQPEPLLTQHGKWSKKTEELRRKSPELFIEGADLGEKYKSHGAIPKKTRSHTNKTTEQVDSPQFTCHKPPIYRPSLHDDHDGKGRRISDHPYHSSATPTNVHEPSHHPVSNVLSLHKSTHNPLTTFSQILPEFKPLDLRSPIDPMYLNKRLPSPKVLFTHSDGAQTFYKKRELDLNSPPLEQNIEERLMTGNIADLVKPLNSDELEAYLSSLSQPLKEKPTPRTELGKIPTTPCFFPTTKCKFYIGDDESSHISTSSDISVSDHHHNKLLGISLEKNRSPSPTVHTSKAFEEQSHEVKTESSSFPPKCLFKKSLSEPGFSLDKLSLCQLELSSSPDQKLSDLDSSLAKSFQDLPFFENENSENGCSSDSSSTPTNSLSERNGAMTKYFKQTSQKIFDIDQSREATPTCEVTSTVSTKCQVTSRETEPHVKDASPNCSSSSSLPITSTFAKYKENKRTRCGKRKFCR